jgi:hypothetical protein|tara:strand:+ start:456 stop:746 length:291 start_codon:yes stop_codon:yes gene_type:complete
MLENPPLNHLSKHLLENHDPEWMFEHLDWDGELAFNCWMPTENKETFIIIRWTDYEILGYGDDVPQGLIDEIQTILADGERIYLDWELAGEADKWA